MIKKALNFVKILLFCFAFVLLILIILAIVSNIYRPRYENSVYYNDRDDLLVLFSYSVPDIYYLDIEMEGDVEIYPIEEDKLGRTLGILQYNEVKKNALFGENAIYCVLQSGSKKECSFYEDVCCVMVENGVDPGEAIEQLKLANDWNKPLLLEQCRTIPIKSGWPAGVYDNDYGYTAYDTIIGDVLGWESRYALFDILCKDGNGLCLCTLEKDYREPESPIVLVMMREDESADPELSIITTRPLENRTSPWEEIHAFKEEMGWHFCKSD